MPRAPRLTTPHGWAKDKTPHQWANHHIRVVTVLIVLLVVCSYPAGVFVLSLVQVRHDQKAAAASAGPVETRPSGSGVVVSMSDGVMTIQHDAVTGPGGGSGAAAVMAAGTTAFPTDPRIITRTRVGDHVTFYLTPGDAGQSNGGGGYAIHSLRNREMEEMGQNPVLGTGK